VTAEGALVTGATMAHFTCLAAARNRVLKQSGWNVDADGLFGAPEITVIVGEEAHATLFKVLSMIGLGRNRVLKLPCDDQGRISPRNLPDIAGPTIVCLQAGNVNSGAFDPAEPLIKWAHSGGAWVHVDGAFGIWALASTEKAALAKGFTAADSWALDAHKWLNVPYDSGIALVADASALRDAMSVSGTYLMPGEHRDAMNVTPDSSRRARAVDIWAALKLMGRQGLSELVERNCRQAHKLAAALHHAGIEVLNDVVLNQVIVSFGSDARTNRVIEKIQDDGECWCGATVWHGRTAMRISVSSWATTDEDIERSLAAILRAAQEIPSQ
jgi:glutamate/tyrosine decarboxylase-like PLP-dependent enzyme